MASNFYIFHQEFRASTSSIWWETVYAAMAPGGGWDDAVAVNKEKGFYNHSANAVTSDGPVYCICESKENITVEESMNLLMVQIGPVLGLNALMKICKPIDTSLMNGQTPYPGVFS